MLMRKHSARGAQPAFPVASNLGYLWPSDIAPVLDNVRRYSIVKIHCGSPIVRNFPLEANRSGYQRRGIWDSYEVVWGDIIIKLPRSHGHAIQP
jgi:hypothetical protein